MNKWIGVGRLTRDPDIRVYGGDKELANFTIAIDRISKQENGPTADFISCVAFGKTAGVIKKYAHKGIKLIVDGTLQNNNYEDRDGVKHYTYNILVNSIEFAESRKNDSSGGSGSSNHDPQTSNDGWVDVTNNVDDEDELPF